MHIGRRIAAVGITGVLVLLPTGSHAAAPAPAATTAAAASVRATAALLPTGRLRVEVRTNASRVSVRYVVSARSTRSLSLPVRKGWARVTLPVSATSVRVRAAAAPGRRAGAWQRLAIPARSPDDAAPSAEQVAAMEQLMLALVNEVRATGATCPGGVDMPPAPALARNPAMDAAARAQAGWQAHTGIMSHEGSGGSSVGQRIAASGYPWTRVAEVVSTGYQLPAETLAQWLGSAGHCRALMDPHITETGIGYAYSETSVLRHFWTQDLARA